MAGYHKFVFDVMKRRFVGRFEEMYQAEEQEGFDSWRQDDLAIRDDVKLCQILFNDRRDSKLIDLGCGKGALTASMPGFAEKTIGFDISPTAIEIARSRYPEIEFQTLDAADRDAVTSVLRMQLAGRQGQDLVVLAQVLCYLPNWREVVREVGRLSADVLILLYQPENPIGFVKSTQELLDEVKSNFSEVAFQESSSSHIAILASPQRTGK